MCTTKWLQRGRMKPKLAVIISVVAATAATPADSIDVEATSTKEGTASQPSLRARGRGDRRKLDNRSKRESSQSKKAEPAKLTPFNEYFRKSTSPADMLRAEKIAAAKEAAAMADEAQRAADEAKLKADVAKKAADKAAKEILKTLSPSTMAPKSSPSHSSPAVAPTVVITGLSSSLKPTSSPSLAIEDAPEAAEDQEYSLPLCPPEYDPSKTDYVAADTISMNSNIYRCRSPPYEQYCNIVNVDRTWNAYEKDLWDNAWDYVEDCDTTMGGTMYDPESSTQTLVPHNPSSSPNQDPSPDTTPMPNPHYSPTPNPVMRVAVAPTTTTVSTSTATSTTIYTDSPTPSPTPSPSTRPTQHPTSVPTESPMIPPSLPPTNEPSKHPTQASTNVSTLSSTKANALPKPACPPSYDYTKTDFVAGDLTEVDEHIFKCREEVGYEMYCNMAGWDDALLEQDENAKEMWDNAWVEIGPCFIISQDDAVQEATSSTTTTASTSTTSSTAISTDSPTTSPTPSPSTRPTQYPTLVPTESPTVPPSLPPSNNPSKNPTQAPTNVPTLSSATGKACPPAYDYTKIDYVAGDLTAVDEYIFKCREEVGYEMYCNMAGWDDALLEQDENAKEMWDNAWVEIGPCSIISQDEAVQEVAAAPTTTMAATSTTSSTAISTDSPTPSPTPSPSTSPTKHPTLVPTESPTVPPSLSPTNNPSKHLTEAPTNLSTLSSNTANALPKPVCPPAYDYNKTDYLSGDLAEFDEYVFQCNKEVGYEMYCNMASWDDALLEQYENTNKSWDNVLTGWNDALLEHYDNAKEILDNALPGWDDALLEHYEMAKEMWEHAWVEIGPCSIIYEDEAVQEATSSTTTTVSTSTATSAVISTDPPTTSPTPSPSTRPTPHPSPAPTESPTVPPSLPPSNNPSKNPTQAPTNLSTLSSTTANTLPKPACPPAYDYTKIDYVAGDLTAVDGYIFKCNEEVGYEMYCNMAGWDDALLEQDENAKEMWDNAWVEIGQCSIISQDEAVQEVAAAPTTTMAATSTTSSTAISTGSPTPSPTPSPSVSPTQHPTLVPTESPMKSPSLPPSNEPSKRPTQAPSNLPTLSSTTTIPDDSWAQIPTCPQAYDYTKTNYVAGDEVEIMGHIFQCNLEEGYEIYCNQASWDNTLLEQNSNAKQMWNDAWVVRGACDPISLEDVMKDRLAHGG